MQPIRRVALDDDRGALTVEMGLIIIPFLGLIMMLVLFGIALNFQISLSNGAREGVRVLALEGDDPTTVALASAGVPGATVTSGRIGGGSGCTIPDDAGQGIDVFVTMSRDFPWQPPAWIGGPFGPISGRAVMRCGG